MTRVGEEHHPGAATNVESDEETTLVVIVLLLLTKPKIYSILRFPQYFLPRTVFFFHRNTSVFTVPDLLI